MLILDCQLEIETRLISEILFALPDKRGHPSNPVGTPLPALLLRGWVLEGLSAPHYVNKNILTIPNAKPNIFFCVSDSPSNVTPISTVNKLINTFPMGST